MKKLNWQFLQMIKHNRDGSYGTQAARTPGLNSIAHQLNRNNKDKSVNDITRRDIEKLIATWQQEDLSIGTIKNRLSYIRWALEKSGNSSIIPHDNAELGIPNRCYVTNVNKAQLLDERLVLVSDAHVRMSLELQAQFGLRREEAMKIRPCIADGGEKLVLKGSWTKGGRPREIPIQTDSQREVLNRAHQLAGKGSLIPADKRYIDQLRVYEKTTLAAGLRNMHGLRHAYAQTCYYEITGWLCPAAGGQKSNELSPEQRAIDYAARLQISAVMGHSRESITATYLGR